MSEKIALPKVTYTAESKSEQKAKDSHVELSKELPDFLNPDKEVSVVGRIQNRMAERIRRFAIAGKHRRVYEVIEFVECLSPGQVCWDQHLFGYGDRGVAFKLARKFGTTVQMYDFRVRPRS